MSVGTLNKTIDNYDGSSDEDIDSTEEAEIRELLGSVPQFAPRTANINFDIAFPPNEILQELAAEIEHHFQEMEDGWNNSSRNVLEDLQRWSCQKQGEVVSDEDVDFAHLFSDESDESIK